MDPNFLHFIPKCGHVSLDVDNDKRVFTIYLQNSASIQPRTSLSKVAKNSQKLEEQLEKDRTLSSSASRRSARVSFAPDNCLAEYFGAGGELSKCPHGRWSKEELENYKEHLALLLQDAELNVAKALAQGPVLCLFQFQIITDFLYFFLMIL